MSPQPGIRANLPQFAQLLLQVLLVGLTVGMTRTVIPALAETEFGVPKGSFLLLTSFVLAFGLVKAVMNFTAGRLAERLGRKRVLLAGWLIALPIPPMIWYSPNWGWIVAATLLLGANQGLAWYMTLTAKLDMAARGERGLAIGLNEFAGYSGVALAGVATAWLASALGARDGLLLFGLVVIILGLLCTLLLARDTLPWVRAEEAAGDATARPRYARGLPAEPRSWQLFALSWRDRRLLAISQAGLVEKFADALVWAIYPLFLYRQGLSLPMVATVTGAYGLTWGAAQLVTGPLSDRIGRQGPNVLGLLICGAGVALMLAGKGFAWWTFCAAISGLGMALLYPNLAAAVADISRPAWRSSALGVYRFWRDLGYCVGVLGLGLAAQWSGRLEAAFWFVSGSLLVSAALLAWLGEETHPALNPDAGVALATAR